MKPATELEAAIALGEVVIVLNKGGMAGRAWIKGHSAPLAVKVDFGGGGVNEIRRVVATVGWTAKGWRDSDPEAIKEIAEGHPRWQALRSASDTESEATA